MMCIIRNGWLVKKIEDNDHDVMNKLVSKMSCHSKLD